MRREITAFLHLQGGGQEGDGVFIGAVLISLTFEIHFSKGYSDTTGAAEKFNGMISGVKTNEDLRVD
jgi:hypothetical protein